MFERVPGGDGVFFASPITPIIPVVGILSPGVYRGPIVSTVPLLELSIAKSIWLFRVTTFSVSSMIVLWLAFEENEFVPCWRRALTVILMPGVFETAPFMPPVSLTRNLRVSSLALVFLPPEAPPGESSSSSEPESWPPDPLYSSGENSSSSSGPLEFRGMPDQVRVWGAGFGAGQAPAAA